MIWALALVVCKDHALHDVLSLGHIEHCFKYFVKIGLKRTLFIDISDSAKLVKILFASD